MRYYYAATSSSLTRSALSTTRESFLLGLMPHLFCSCTQHGIAAGRKRPQCRVIITQHLDDCQNHGNVAVQGIQRHDCCANGSAESPHQVEKALHPAITNQDFDRAVDESPSNNNPSETRQAQETGSIRYRRLNAPIRMLQIRRQSFHC